MASPAARDPWRRVTVGGSTVGEAVSSPRTALHPSSVEIASPITLPFDRQRCPEGAIRTPGRACTVPARRPKPPSWRYHHGQEAAPEPGPVGSGELLRANGGEGRREGGGVRHASRLRHLRWPYLHPGEQLRYADLLLLSLLTLAGHTRIDRSARPRKPEGLFPLDSPRSTRRSRTKTGHLPRGGA